MHPFKVLRLLSVLGLALALVGPVPSVPVGPIESVPHPAASQASEPPSPIAWPAPIEPQAPLAIHTIHLKTGDLTPGASDTVALNRLARSDGGRVHVLLQLDFIPRDAAKAEYAQRGVKLLAYVPDFAWIASVPARDPAAVLNLTGVTWGGPLTVDEKLDPAIVEGAWAAFNLTPDGTAAVYVVTHLDEDVTATRALIEKYGGKITSEVPGIRTLVVEMPQRNIRALAAEEPIQWIAAAEPPLREANDGIRQQIGVDALQAAPYNLNGTGVDVLIYDGGQVGAHVDFGTRLTHGDGAAVSDHSTHVAGTVGGSGANSINQGGTDLQWRGVATNTDLISYAYQWNNQGMLFYNNPGDIEADWAAAQNTYGADLGTASLGSNIYANYPLSCTMMGKYGLTEVLLDQIVRGGNGTVGLGDKYIATWAAGNERGWVSSCGTYDIVAPPAGAKNPIQVGGSNTNDNTQYAHTSWGPTEDGRIKPIVTAGACQTSGDLGITSTDNNPVDAYTVKCGTSMATPAVAGSIALMLQHYRTVYNTTGNFWPSTAKAILIQTADDFGNPGPDYQWGFGQVDAKAAVDLISRRAFRQDNIAQGATDVFYFIVPTTTQPAQVVLVWDDFEATFNANPTLINNLDLELEAPSGAIWRPWVLNPASPTSNATRAINTVDNQEEVTVPSPEIGTWIVRVKGTTVPQGPQDYSLACEGCKPLDAGVCQSKVSTAVVSAPAVPELESGALNSARQVTLPEAIAAGEQWQRSLEQLIGDRQPADQAALLEQARQQGDEAVVALRETLTGTARDRAMDDIVAAQQRLSEAAPPPPAIPSVSTAEEQARLEADHVAEIANRAQALTQFGDPNEGAGPNASQVGNLPSGPTADLTVGNGCTYATIAAAITAAGPGDRLLIEGGRTFTENLTVNKNLTLQGGYNGCASGSTARTVINGNNAGTAVVVNAGLTVTLQSLNLTNGSYSGEGGGIRFAYGGTGLLTLTNVDVYSNTAQWGGGLWVGQNADVVGTGVNIYNNTASTYGGGLRLFGSRATLNYGNIYSNTAPWGGGIYATKETGAAPALDLPHSADVYGNHSTTGSGLGGGVYLREGTASLADCSDIYSNGAINGGGAYLITSTLTINGSCSEIDSNTANANGGGVYAQGSSIVMQDQAELLYNTAGVTSTADGGGAYLDNSSLYSYRSAIRYNTASDDGGGVAANNGSNVDLELGSYSCIGLRCSQVSNNTANGVGYGGGIYANSSSVSLYNTFVENNTADFGGGLYIYNTTAYLYNGLVARNNSTSGTGDGIRLNTANFYGANNTLAYNDTGGAATGRSIDMYSSNLSLACSVIWGHSSSIDAAGQNVTYSDIQGGYAGSTNLNVNPLFVAAGSQDYHLQATSPVVDRCVSGQATDFESEPRPIVRTTAAAPYDMGADEVSGIDRVGVNGACAYGTIQQAVNAANDGDTIRVASGVYFENVDITAGKVITIEGGYDNTCASTGASTTRIDGSASSGSVIDILGGTTKLHNLQVAWGSGTGGGIDVDSHGQVTLDNAAVFNNHGDYGGGVWLNTGSAVTITNGSTVHDNTATSPGGGVRAWGKFYGYGTTSDTYNNCASDGGGFSVPGGQVYLDNADVIANQAAGATGRGGGFLVESGGVVSLINSVFVGEATPQMNTAYDGGGIYADNATVLLDGTATTVDNNEATHAGGGVYLINNALLRSTGSRIGYPTSTGGANNAAFGAGIYAITSTIDFAGTIVNNIATNDGGGIMLSNAQLNLHHAIVQRNVASRGGGVYQEGTGSNSLIANTLMYSNTASVNLGGGIRTTGGTLTATHVTLANSYVGAGLSSSGNSYVYDSIAWGNGDGGFWPSGAGTITGTCNIDQSSKVGANVDPLFVSPGAGEDYHVLKTSPAVEACDTGLPDDLEHRPRPLGLRYDMGAYEYLLFALRLPIILK